jgi:hypothetical protein
MSHRKVWVEGNYGMCRARRRSLRYELALWRHIGRILAAAAKRSNGG